MTGFVDQGHTGVLTRDDGVEIFFRKGAVVGTTFESLQIGARVEYSPLEGSPRVASVVRLIVT